MSGYVYERLELEMSSSCSSNVAALQKQMEGLSDVEIESSQNISDLLADISTSPSVPTSPPDDNSVSSLSENGASVEVTPESKCKKGRSLLSSSAAGSFGLVSPGSSSDIGGESDTKVFLAAFNSKYNVNVSTLFDVLDVVEDIIGKSKAAAKEESKIVIDDSKVRELKVANVKIQSEKEALSRELAVSQTQIGSLENQIVILKNENKALSDNLNALQKENNGLRQTLESMNQMMEAQMNEMCELGDQRSQLIDLSRRQGIVIEELEKLSKTQSVPAPKPKNETNLAKKQSTDDADEMYSLMSSIVNEITNSQTEEFAERICAIRDGSKKPVKDRIMDMVSSVISRLADCEAKMEAMSASDKEASDQVEHYKQKAREILGFLEEELAFLQALTHSSDIQAAVFRAKQAPDASILSEESKTELIRKCALIGRFIEENLSEVTSERIDEKVPLTANIQPTHIFELMQSSSFEEKLTNLSHLIDDNASLTLREVFDLLTAQVFINDLLKDHATDLHMRIAHCGHEIGSLKQEIEDTGDDLEQIEAMKKLVRHFRRRESKLRKYLSNYIEVSDQAAPVDMVEVLIQKINDRIEKYHSDAVQSRKGQEAQNGQSSSSTRRNESASSRKGEEQRKTESSQSRKAEMVVDDEDEYPSSRKSSSHSSRRSSRSEKNRSEESRHSGKSGPRLSRLDEVEEELQRKDEEIESLKQELVKVQEKNEENERNRQIETEKHTKELQCQLDAIKDKLHDVVKQSEDQRQECLALKEELASKVDEIETLNKSTETMKESHQQEVTELNQKITSSQAQIETMTKQISEFETVLTNVKKQRQNLGNQIERLKNANTRLQESLDCQSAKIRDEFNAEIVRLAEEKEQVCREKEALTSEIRILTAKNQQLSSENSSLNITKKSAELKLRGYQERLDSEKKNMQAKLTAHIAATQATQSKQVSELNEELEMALNELSGLIPDGVEAGDLRTMVSTVEEEFEKMRTAQYSYVELLEDVNEVQRMLGIATTEKIAPIIRDIVNRKATNDKFTNESEQRKRQEASELDKLRKEVKKAEGQSGALIQWERWAKRVYRVVHEAEAVNLSNDQLRMTLEEALLASVSHKDVYMRIDSLRNQKAILMKYDKRVLLTRQSPKAAFRPVIALCMFTRRVQKIAGCLPMSLSSRASESAASTARSKWSDDQITPKRHRSSSSHSSSSSKRSKSVSKKSDKSPLKPLIPLRI